MKKQKSLIFIGILFFILGLLRLNDLSIYTDCTRYLIWGNSIAHAKGFVDDTQPVPEHYIVNAPFFPVILAPVLFFFPLSLTAAKIWTLLWGIFALILFYNWLRIYLDKTPAFLASLLLALNPLALILSTEVLSETCFLCGLFGGLILLENLKNDKCTSPASIILIIIISTITLVREVSVAFVAAAIIYLLLTKRWRTSFILSAGAVFVFSIWTYRNLVIVGVPQYSQNPNLVYIFRHFVTPQNTTFFYEMAQRILINFKYYSAGLSGMLFYYIPSNLIVHPSNLFITTITILNLIQQYIFLLFLPSLIIGIYKDFTGSRTAILRFLFFIIYLLIILIYPVQDVRFILPLIPFAIFYSAVSITSLLNSKHTAHFRHFPVYIVIFISITLPNIICIYEMLRTNLSYQRNLITFSADDIKSTSSYYYFSTPWDAFGNWINREIQEGSVIATPDKCIVTFAPKQKFLELNYSVPLPQFESLIRSNAIDYLLAPTIYDSISEYQTLMNESMRFRFKQNGKMGRLNLFQVESRLEMPADKSMESNVIPDTNDSYNLLSQGRLCLRTERYAEALSIFNILQNRFPHNSNIKYQTILVHTFAMDSIKAKRVLQELYSLPLAGSFIQPAQLHIQAMNSLFNAQNIPGIELRAITFCEVGRLYWNLGYPNQAYRIIKQAVQLDSASFISLLWAWNYGIQIGDTQNASKYLKMLERIDRQNPIVKSFEKIASYQESLKSAVDHKKRSNLHIAISREFNAIDLREESLDEAQLAVGENPTDTMAYQYLADLFKIYNYQLAQKKALQKVSHMEASAHLY